jgi:DNA repair exonuclease SbcCD ATPase subunit
MEPLPLPEPDHKGPRAVQAALRRETVERLLEQLGEVVDQAEEDGQPGESEELFNIVERWIVPKLGRRDKCPTCGAKLP